MSGEKCQTVHGTCIAWNGRGALLLGASGSGKSSLALSLMAMGATLVADDRVRLMKKDQGVTATAPPGATGLIEARGIGILRADVTGSANLAVVVDMEQIETARFPEMRTITLLDFALPLLHRVEIPHFAAALLQLLKAGRHAPT